MSVIENSVRSMRMAAIMKSNPSASAAQASAPTGSVFRNLMSAPPTPASPSPAPPAEHKPVRPSVEPNAMPAAGNEAETTGEGAQSGIKVQRSSAPGTKSGRQPMFTASDLRRNFIITEVLGKPVSLRRK